MIFILVKIARETIDTAMNNMGAKLLTNRAEDMNKPNVMILSRGLKFCSIPDLL